MTVKMIDTFSFRMKNFEGESERKCYECAFKDECEDWRNIKELTSNNILNPDYSLGAANAKFCALFCKEEAEDSAMVYGKPLAYYLSGAALQEEKERFCRLVVQALRSGSPFELRNGGIFKV